MEKSLAAVKLRSVTKNVSRFLQVPTGHSFARAAAVAFVAAAFCVPARPLAAESISSATGTVVTVTATWIDVKVDRQVMRFALADGFSAVYGPNSKAKVPIGKVTPGKLVRVTFVKTTLGDNYRKATEIDILTGFQFTMPTPIPTASPAH